jgi:1-acyl-sn-glycerol-3-phosphate acyltransferase
MTTTRATLQKILVCFWILTVQAFQNTGRTRSIPSRRYVVFTRDKADDNRGAMMIGPLEAAITKFSMMTYIASMCIALPVTLFPIWGLHKAGLISKSQREHMSLQTGQLCAMSLLHIIPFVNLTVIPFHEKQPEPTIWCANHVSALDTFLLLAADEKLRGKNKRPIKVIYVSFERKLSVWLSYFLLCLSSELVDHLFFLCSFWQWKGLDENPITKLLFHMAGFIPVQMPANIAGIPNEYDRGSFKSMLKLSKQAFQDGFDLLILPEGQLNPNPQKGLMPVFPGAYALAKISKRPIRLVGIHGSNRLWNADESIGMRVTGRNVQMRAYPPGKEFESADEFVETFNAILGYFGSKGEDLPEKELQWWLNERE